MLHTTAEGSGYDRVRRNTVQDVNERLDAKAESRVQAGAQGRKDVSRELKQLDREWDFERIVEAEGAATGLAGLALGVFADRRFLIVPGVVAAMTLLHAVQGWYPLLPVLRRTGVRTQHEIDRERFAMKAVRGDFEEVAEQRGESRAQAAWRAAGA